jgi:hypothetical protein
VRQDRDVLTGDPGATDASQQLLGLAREHRAGDHLDPAAAPADLASLAHLAATHGRGLGSPRRFGQCSPAIAANAAGL